MVGAIVGGFVGDIVDALQMPLWLFRVNARAPQLL